MPADRWHLSSLAHEAVRNVTDPRARLFPALVLAVLAGSGIATVAALEAASLQDQLAALQMQGRLVVEISSTRPEDPVAIDRASCEELADQPGVDRAGIVALEGFYDIPQLGAAVSVTAASVTLFPALQHADALVGSALREPSPDFRMTMPTGSVATARVMAAQPTGIDTNSTVLVALGPDQATGPSCRVVLDPYSDPAEATARVVAALRATGDQPITASTPFQDTVNPVHTFLTRFSRYLPLLVGLLGGFASAVIDRVRLSELAAYRLSGTSGRSLALLVMGEQVMLGGTLAAAGALAGVVTIALLGYPASLIAVTRSALAAAAAWILTAGLLTLDVPLRRPTDLAKDR